MADNWAAFKTSNDAEKEGDDDWAEFGGFESASPSSNPFGDSSAVSAGFPWVTAFTAVSQQPIPASPSSQSAFPSQTSVFPSTSEQAPPANVPQAQPSNFFDPGEYASLKTPHQVTPSHATLPNQQPSTHGSIPTQPIPPQRGVPPQATVIPTQVTIPNQQRSSLGDIPTQQTPHQGFIPNKANVIPSNDFVLSTSREVTTESAPPIPSREHRNSSGASQAKSSVLHETRLNEVQGELKQANEKVSEYQSKLNVSGEKLSLAEREKIRLQQSLEEMKKKYNETADVAKEQYLEIERQKEKYDILQDEHKEQLKKLKEAGQESFALIVEEYKELAKTAVSQERENNEKHLQRILEEEREKFTTFVNQQGDNLKLLVKEEQANNLKKLEKELEEQKTKHQAELNECLEEERRRGKEALEKALEGERARAKVLTDELINNQKKEFENFIEEQKRIFQVNLADERKATAKEIDKVLKDEQERARNDLYEAMAEERQKSRDAVGVIKEKTKDDMGQYIKEKEKADEAVRQRTYQSMDLFLQGVQTQLRSLINNSDIPPSS